MEKISLNGDTILLGVDTVIGIGYNMKCKHVISKSILCKDEDGYYLKCKGGINVLIPESSLHDYYLDTKDNRKILKSLINSK